MTLQRLAKRGAGDLAVLEGDDMSKDERTIREPDTHGRTELPRGGYQSTRVARVRMVDGDLTLKIGEFERHTIYSDEGPRSGGEDRYPTPLGYMAMAVGF